MCEISRQILQQWKKKTYFPLRRFTQIFRNSHFLFAPLFHVELKLSQHFKRGLCQFHDSLNMYPYISHEVKTTVKI